MDVTVILPIYNERENLRPLLKEIDEALSAGQKFQYEVIAIDDGSRDGSTELLKELTGEYKSLKVIFFRKNAGQTAAFDAGFRHASGRFVVTMDSDLQNDPHDIPHMIAQLGDQYDVISGWRKKRKDGFVLRRLPSLFANRMIRKVTGAKVHDMGCSLKVYRREITNELRLYGEMHRFITVLAEGVGARVGECVVNHRPRVAGKSKYGLTRTVKVVLDLLTVWFIQGYGTKPIYVFGLTGVGLIGAGLFTSVVVLYQKFESNVYAHRNPLLVLAATFGIVGVQFLGLGLMTEIIIRTYYESRNKAAYHIRQILGFETK